MPEETVLLYEPNPKHKPLPSPGRRGTICPPGVVGADLLPGSVLHGSKRFATDGLHAFCAQQHDPERDAWHGYPVSWPDVPPAIVRAWTESIPGLRREIRRASRRGSNS